jgi:2-iminobutanoate/2-iminopropanoate deaminase
MATKEAFGTPIVLPNGKTAPFSPAFRGGDQLFVSGQLAFQPDGKVSSGDIETQTQICLAHIDRIVTEAGLSKDDIARVGIWLTNPGDFVGFNTAYAAYFGEHRPARACVVSELVLPGALVEIDAIAIF